MKANIIYISNHGTTEKLANIIASKLNKENFETNIINLRNNPKPDIDGADVIILGSSIHAGKVQKKMKIFCISYLNKLKNKPLALYACLMDDEKKWQEFEIAYPEELRVHSFANAVAGGEFLFEKMNFIERAIIKKIAKTNKSISKLDYNAIYDFVDKIVKNKYNN